MEEEELFNKSISKLSIIKISDSEYRKEALLNASRVFSVPASQLPATIERFISEIKEGMTEIKKLGGELKYTSTAKNIAEASEIIFETWKTKNKVIEELQGKESKKILEDIEKDYNVKYEEVNGTRVVKRITSGIEMKILTEIAKTSVQKGSRLTILVNKNEDKCNIIIASKSGVKAGEVCKKLSEQLGGGGGGSPTLGIGGGKTENMEKIVGNFKV